MSPAVKRPRRYRGRSISRAFIVYATTQDRYHQAKNVPVEACECLRLVSDLWCLAAINGARGTRSCRPLLLNDVTRSYSIDKSTFAEQTQRGTRMRPGLGRIRGRNIVLRITHTCTDHLCLHLASRLKGFWIEICIVVDCGREDGAILNVQWVTKYVLV